MIAANSRNGVEVADIFRQYIGAYRERYKMPLSHLKVAGAILNCRTAILGGHIERCDNCRAETNAYNSCRNRHCPKCQCLTKERWLSARKAELLPVRYFHVVFTLPHALNPVVLTNKRKMLGILFKAVSGTLLSFGRNPENGLGGQLGFISILHTWDQRLRDHFHLHCLVPAGALSADKSRWIDCKRDFLFRVEPLSSVFRGKFMAELKAAFQNGKLIFPGQTKPQGTRKGFKDLVNRCYATPWVVNIREPIKKPEYVLDYLGRYTHRVAISNDRILGIEDGKVRFTYKNLDTGEILEEQTEGVEFIHRFLLHALPKGFMRIRHYGFLANRYKKQKVQLCRKLLGCSNDLPEPVKETIREIVLRLTGADIMRCPHCKKGRMVTIAAIPKGVGLVPL